MASIQRYSFILSFSLCIQIHLLSFGVYSSSTFTILNKCSYTVWPGILSGAGTPQLSTTGFALQPGGSTTLDVPTSWSGRIWGRTYCTQDSTTGKFSCATADCASGVVDCNGAGAVPPATLAEFTLNGANGLDFYDVSLVDGYNLPMLVAPQGGLGGGNCTSIGCMTDLNGACPSELRVTGLDGGEGVACKSACGAFGEPQYCCSGAYGSPDTCEPSQYSEFFKNACPRAYSYAYDDGTSTFSCASANYVITFCPSPTTSLKSSQKQDPQAVQVSSSGPHINPPKLIIGIVVAAPYLTLSLVLWGFLFSYCRPVPGSGHTSQAQLVCFDAGHH